METQPTGTEYLTSSTDSFDSKTDSPASGSGDSFPLDPRQDKSAPSHGTKKYAHSNISGSDVSRTREDRGVFTILIDSSLITSLSQHCFSDRYAPVYGLLMGTIFEKEHAAHLCGFVPCERDQSSLIDKKLAVSQEAKQAAFDQISSLGSCCIGSYCSDFSAIASFGNDLMLPVEKRITTSLLLRIFVNNKIGTSANENGNFLSSLSAFVIKNGTRSASFRVQIRIRDVLFTPEFSLATEDSYVRTMLAENKKYLDSLLSSASSHPGDQYVLACEFDKYLLNSLQNDFVPQFNVLESEMKRISMLKQTLKTAIHSKLKELHETKEKETFDAIEKAVSYCTYSNASIDGRITEWSKFREATFLQSSSSANDEGKHHPMNGKIEKKVGRPASSVNASSKIIAETENSTQLLDESASQMDEHALSSRVTVKEIPKAEMDTFISNKLASPVVEDHPIMESLDELELKCVQFINDHEESVSSEAMKL